MQYRIADYFRDNTKTRTYGQKMTMQTVALPHLKTCVDGHLSDMTEIPSHFRDYIKILTYVIAKLNLQFQDTKRRE